MKCKNQKSIDFINSIKSKNTARSYDGAISNLENHISQTRDVLTYNMEHLKYKDLAEFSSYLTNTLHNKESTHNNRLVIVQKFLGFLELYAEDEDIKKNMIYLIANIKKLKQSQYTEEAVFFTEDELIQIASHICRNEKNKERWLAIFLIYVDTANRKSEVANMNIGDIVKPISDDINWYIKTNNKNKSKAPKKHCLTEDTVLAIQDYLGTRGVLKDDDPLFLSNNKTRIDAGTIAAKFKKIFKELRFSNDYSLHSIRHSVLTRITDEQGISAAQKVAGHSSIAITQRYAHVSDKLLQNVRGRNIVKEADNLKIQ